MSAPDPRRDLPAVDAALEDPAIATLLDRHPRGAVVDALRTALAARRSDRRGPDLLADEVAARLRPSLRRVVNATGVLLNTNLGRAPLAEEAVDAAVAAAGYATLEWDPPTGERGSRHAHVEAHLRELTGAEAGCVVNTNAAAVLLSLCATGGSDDAGPREVVVSRGQLVEIGGGFRVPEILATSGCRLVEVGTTNRTRIEDYAAACNARTALILRVHQSNFRQVGFVEQTPLAALTALARERGLAVIDDLGSGALTPDPLFAGEPDVRSSVAAGADLVCFSADKLLGGPQAGIVVGRADAVGAVARHPLARALRCDKLRLAALEATLALHRDPEQARRRVPALRTLARTADERHETAERLARVLGGEVIPTAGRVGGGAMPEVDVPSFAVALPDLAADALAARLREGEPAVAARVGGGRVLIDVLALGQADLVALPGAVARARA